MNIAKIRLFIFIALLSCQSQRNDQVFKKPWYKVSTGFGFEPNSRQYKTLKNKDWLVHRDHFFNDMRVNLEIQYIEDSSVNEISIQDVIDRTNIIVENEIEVEINGLKGKKVSGSALVFDSQTNKNLRFYKTVWILKGRHLGIFNVVLNSVDQDNYDDSLDSAEKMVNTIQEILK